MATNNVVPGGALNENSFLQLLATQMKYQDPMAPQDNTAFIAQLAQFTSLEQMTNVATSSQSILQSIQSLQSMMQMEFAHQLIGANVTVGDGSGSNVTGTVSAISFNGGNAQLMINGTSYPLASVVGMG